LSIQLINQYYTKREKLIQYGGSKNELSVRDAFKDLINHYAEKKHLLLIPELRVMGCTTSRSNRILKYLSLPQILKLG